MKSTVFLELMLCITDIVTLSHVDFSGDICSAILSDLGLVAGTLVRRLQLEAS